MVSTLEMNGRVSPEDLMSLAAERGSTPLQVGAVLMLDASDGLDTAIVVATLTSRITTVPRLRQRLLNVPWGCGRPMWVDDPTFVATEHLSVVRCPAPGGRGAVLDVAASLLTTRLPRDRPLWAATLVTDVGLRRAALIFIVHHILADGIGGLAVLGALLDGAGGTAVAPFPVPGPSRRALAIDAAAGHFRSLCAMPAALRRLGRATRQLRSGARGGSAHSSLNRPTGPRRYLATVRTELDEIQRAAHAHGVTVNDIVLSAIAVALHRLLASRGEQIDEFVISVPFSARRHTTADDLGNHSGVIPIRISAVGGPLERLTLVAESTRMAKKQERGASTAILGPLFRLLASLGLYKWFIDHQRFVNTFATNLAGPRERMTLLNCPVTTIIPLTVTTGNVTVSFAAMSYAGSFTITLIADPGTCPDLPALRDVLDQELALLTVVTA